jgi:hypothetical protein
MLCYKLHAQPVQNKVDQNRGKAGLKSSRWFVSYNPKGYLHKGYTYVIIYVAVNPDTVSRFWS